jgi:hypothetical protein
MSSLTNIHASAGRINQAVETATTILQNIDPLLTKQREERRRKLGPEDLVRKNQQTLERAAQHGGIVRRGMGIGQGEKTVFMRPPWGTSELPQIRPRGTDNRFNGSLHSIHYSALSARMGSTEAARRAGSRAAKNAAARSTAILAKMTAGSPALVS